ncbi:MAG TPA: hypothetical protein VLT32_09835 [Candidatus Sulfomarinibacteraceae bacterium]|nr:hypothetical protein [Candidatus Sulfomarinibacteraceae bacterium]
MKHETAFPIGSGGMGEVFKAWDAALERWIALKYLRHDDPVLVERLMREAPAQARGERELQGAVVELDDEAKGHGFVHDTHRLPRRQPVGRDQPRASSGVRDPRPSSS